MWMLEHEWTALHGEQDVLDLKLKYLGSVGYTIRGKLSAKFDRRSSLTSHNETHMGL